LVNAQCLNKFKYQNPLTVRLQNSSTMESTHTASLYIPELKKAASMAHVFTEMESQSLLSVGKLCNEGYSVTFRIDAVTIYNSQEVQILKGARELNTGLWRINLRKEHRQLRKSALGRAWRCFRYKYIDHTIMMSECECTLLRLTRAMAPMVIFS
jgi:hypothetical protein